MLLCSGRDGKQQPIHVKALNVYADFFAALKHAREQGPSMVMVIFTCGFYPYLDYLCNYPEDKETFKRHENTISYALLPVGDEGKDMERLQRFRLVLEAVPCVECFRKDVQWANTIDSYERYCIRLLFSDR